MREHLKILTINTDASFCPKTKAAGYAVYIKCNLFKITKSGILKNAENSIDAEMMAIGNAAHIVTSLQDAPYFGMIVINTDCKVAIDMLTKAPHIHKKGTARKVYRILQKLRSKTNPPKKRQRFELRHVLAHNGTPDAISFVNDWCDKTAKAEMKKARSIKEETNL